MEGRKLVFRRTNGSSRIPGGQAGVAGGVSDAARSFEWEGMMTTSRHPMIGALKGTFTIAPGWDLTRPALDPEDLAEWDARLEHKAEMIEKGLSDKRL